MNKTERLLKQLEAATARRDDADADAAAVADGAPSAGELRAAWRQLAQGLNERDGRLRGDQPAFLAGLLARVDAEQQPTLVRPAARAAAIVRCLRDDDRPLSAKGWLALVACIAVVGAAVMWFDFGASRESGHSANRRTESTESAKPTTSDTVVNSPAAKQTQPPTTDRVAAEALAAPIPAWDEPVDAAIAAAHQQLSSLRETTHWERSLLAIERYRQSVERELDDELAL